MPPESNPILARIKPNQTKSNHNGMMNIFFGVAHLA